MYLSFASVLVLLEMVFPASVWLAGLELVSMWAEGDSVPRFSVCPPADTSGSSLTARVKLKT